MKKIACVFALLLSGAGAQAQSSVTMYGLIDVAVGVTDAGGAARHVTEMTSGVGLGSRLGFRGSEDLGGGMKANFVLENGFNPDTGTLGQGGALFGRQAWVGMSSARGWSLSMGRQYSPVLLALASTDPGNQGYWGNNQGTGNGLYQGPGSGAGTGGHQATGRLNNSVVVSGTSGPFTARLMVALGDETNQGTGRLASVGGTYAAGRVLVTGAITRFRQYAQTIVPGADPSWQTEYVLGGAYDFGFMKLFAGYYSYDPSGANLTPPPTTSAGMALDPRFDRTRSYWIGTRAPVGPGTLIVNLMRTNFEFSAGADGHGNTVGVTYEYPLSRRTLLYGSFGRVVNNDTGRVSLLAAIPAVFPSEAGADPKALSIGVRHAF